MQRQPDVVAAAHALRAWVHAQRATWAEVDPSFAESTGDVAFDEPVPAGTRAPVFTPVRPIELNTADDLLFEPSAAPTPAASSLPAADAAVPPQADPEREVGAKPRSARLSLPQVPWGRIASVGMRAAAGLLLVAALAGAVFYGGAAWRKYASAPRLGTLHVESAQPGTEVFVDRQAVGTPPLQLELAPGPHTVEFRRQRASRTVQVRVVRGEAATARVDWTERLVGTLRVDSEPSGARVLVDGKPRGTTPLTLADVTAGAHTVVIESSAGTVRRRVQIVEGQTELLNESIFPGWVHVSAPVDVVVIADGKALRLDTSQRAMLPSGQHRVVLENRQLGISQSFDVNVEPGGTASVALEAIESTLTVTASTDAEITIDGTRVGPAPVVQNGVRVGTHEVIAVDAAGNTRRRTVRVTAQPSVLHFDFSTR